MKKNIFTLPDGSVIDLNRVEAVNAVSDEGVAYGKVFSVFTTGRRWQISDADVDESIDEFRARLIKQWRESSV